MRHLSHLAVVACTIAAFMTVSCNGDKKPLDKPEVKVEESSKAALVQTEIPADAAAAEKVTFTANEKWTATILSGAKADDAASWVKVSPDHGEAGTYSLTITLEENPDPEPRSARIKVACGDSFIEISLTQTGAEITIFNQWEIVGMDEETGATGSIELFEKSLTDGFDVTEKMLYKNKESGVWEQSFTVRDFIFESGDEKGGKMTFYNTDKYGRESTISYTFTINGTDMVIKAEYQPSHYSNTLYLKRVCPPVSFTM